MPNFFSLKKVLKYSLIFLFFSGFFFPLSSVHAETYAECMARTPSPGQQACKVIGDADTKAKAANANPNDTAAADAAKKAADAVGKLNQRSGGSCDSSDVTSFFTVDCWLDLIGQLVYNITTKLAAFFLWITGTLLDFIVNYTVVDFAKNIKDFTGINIAWKVIRDLMNIAFIFLLVYQAIKLIIGLEAKEKIGKWVAMLVLVSLLINFSLFFTKLMIDASNIVTTGFYNSILGSADTTGAMPAGTGAKAVSGLSAPFMSSLGMTEVYSSASFDDVIKQAGKGNMLTFAVMSTVLFVVVGFVFLAIAVLFAVRYLTLLILLMLSPIAYMGLVLSFMDKYSKKWWDSLNGQLLFAPVYMLMTWVVLTLMTSPGFIVKGSWGELITNTVQTGGSSSKIGLLFNFIVIIGLAIASLVIAKGMASQGSDLIGKAIGSATAFAGGALLGGGAWLGRTSVGRIGSKVADNATLQDKAKNAKGLTGAGARLTLYASQKARSGSFDARAAKIPTNMIGDAIEGTVGKTRAGKFLGLNDVNIPSVEVGSTVSGYAGTGKAGTKGFKEIQAESQKRVRDREAVVASELALAQAKKAVIDGSKNEATEDQINAMEKALSKLSVKETETLVASNRELLDSLNFANKISVQQLEALNKSDQFSESEKSRLRNGRFAGISAINDAAGLAAIAIRKAGARPLTNDEIIAAKRVDDARDRIKALADSELEMVDSNYYDPLRPEGQEFISQLKSGQVDAINKSNKFTATQKEGVKKQRIKPLMDALATGIPADIKREIRKVDIKTMVGYMRTPGPVAGGPNIALDPNVLDTYTIKTLQRMAVHENMTDGDISTLRTALLARLPAGHPVEVWLNDQNKGVIEFPA